MRFLSAMATIEYQEYVIARTFWRENILLVSGRLVFFLCGNKVIGTIEAILSQDNYTSRF